MNVYRRFRWFPGSLRCMSDHKHWIITARKKRRKLSILLISGYVYYTWTKASATQHTTLTTIENVSHRNPWRSTTAPRCFRYSNFVTFLTSFTHHNCVILTVMLILMRVDDRAFSLYPVWIWEKRVAHQFLYKATWLSRHVSLIKGYWPCIGVLSVR